MKCDRGIVVMFKRGALAFKDKHWYVDRWNNVISGISLQIIRKRVGAKSGGLKKTGLTTVDICGAGLGVHGNSL